MLQAEAATEAENLAAQLAPRINGEVLVRQAVLEGGVPVNVVGKG